MKRAALIVAALAAAAATGGAGAHAFLDRALPAVGSVVHGTPGQVKLWFSQEIEPAFSTVKVLDANGHQVDRMDKRVDTGDATLLTVSLPSLAPGIYRVVWRVLSVDTHVTEGDFTFELTK